MSSTSPLTRHLLIMQVHSGFASMSTDDVWLYREISQGEADAMNRRFAGGSIL